MFIKRRKGIIVADRQQYGDYCCRALARQCTLYEEKSEFFGMSDSRHAHFVIVI